MIHIDDLSGYSFGASDLYYVCEKYAARLVKSAEAVQLDFEPTETNRTAIRQLMDKSLQKAWRHSIYRRLTAVAAVIVIVFSTIMVTNAYARDAFIRWWNEVWEDRIVYFFDDDSIKPEAVHYALGWVPEGFKLVDEYYEGSYGNLYYSCGDRMIVYEYSALSEMDMIDILGTDEGEQVVVGDKSFSYYQDLSDGSNIMIWIDETKEIVHIINADLTKTELTETMLSIRDID